MILIYETSSMNTLTLRVFVPQSKEMVHAFPRTMFHVYAYTDCLIGKKITKSFVSHIPMRAQDKLDVIHIYVCGPFDTMSLG